MPPPKDLMSATPTLTNCYIPLPIPPPPKKKPSTSPPKTQTRHTGDGTSTPRSNHSLRHLCLSTSVLPNSTGSSLVELGHTKVLCSVHGPRPITSSSLPSGSGGGGGEFKGGSDGGVLHTEVRFAPKFGIRPTTLVSTSHSSIDGSNPTNTSSSNTEEEVELSVQLHNAISPCLNLKSLVKCVMDVYVVVLQNDGNVLGAVITAASLALADCGGGVVEMYDLVCACSVAVVPNALHEKKGDDDGNDDNNDEEESGEVRILADPTEEETIAAMISSSSNTTGSGGGGGGGGIVTLAIMPNWKEVTLWNQSGCMSTIHSSDAVNTCRDGCATMYKFMRNCLVNKKKKGGAP